MTAPEDKARAALRKILDLAGTIVIHDALMARWAAAIAEASAAVNTPVEILLPTTLEEDSEVDRILGTLCFVAGPIAQELVKLGIMKIPARAESEQARVIHWMLGLHAKYGSRWRDVATRILSGEKISKAPEAKDPTKASYITTTVGGSGYFAVMLWWNDSGDHDLPGFWEPYQTGLGRFSDRVDAENEGREWAEAEGLVFYPDGKGPA